MTGSDGPTTRPRSSLPRSRLDRSVVQALVHVATGMGIPTIAEYVDSEEIVGMLGPLGVDYAQGFHVGKPQPLEQILS